MNVNKAIIVGRITNDLELKTTPTGREVLSFSVATNRRWKDQAGQQQEKTDFHNIVSWGKQAATLAQYCVKGQEMFLEGHLETRTWDDADGKKNYRTEVVLDQFEFGSKPGAGGGGAQSQSAAHAPQAQTPAKSADSAPAPAADYPTDEIDPDDIPF